MSYDIYFINKKDVNLDNIYQILESENVTASDDYFISKDVMIQLKESFESKGLVFETFEGKNEDYIELNFPSYQISMYNSQIAVSLPYWGENSSEDMSQDVEIITNIFIENGFVGFDPQTEEIISEEYNFQTSFDETLSVVNEQFAPQEKGNQSNLMYYGIGIGGIIIFFLIWKFLKK